MSQAIQIVLCLITKRHGIQAFSQQFRERVTSLFWIPWVAKRRGQRLRQSELVVRLSQQQHTRIRSQTLVRGCNLDGTIKTEVK